MPKRILVYGTGVIGSVYALRFAKAGNLVSALARGDRLEALRKNALRIKNVFLGEEESAEINALEQIPEGAEFDIVLVAVRSGQITVALTDIVSRVQAGAIVVIGNNLEDYEAEAALVGEDRFVLGFGAFGGYREDGIIVYTDGRTKEKPGDENRSKTTLGVLSPAAQPALESISAALSAAGLPTIGCGDMRSWLVCHAALVFPLAGAIYAAGGEQARTCRTRDAILLGVRACKELFGALGRLGYATEPKTLKRLIASPEWFLTPMLQKSFASEAARVAMFGHANAPHGRGEIAGQASVLDAIVRRAGCPLPSWDRLLPYFAAEGPNYLMPDGSKKLRYRVW